MLKMASSLKFIEVFRIMNNVYNPDGEKMFAAENILQKCGDNNVSTDRSKDDGNILVTLYSQ